MITRRLMISCAAAAVGVGAVGGVAIQRRGVPDRQPVTLFTDSVAEDLQFGKSFAAALGQSLGGPAETRRTKKIPEKALSDLRSGVAWMKDSSGASLIVVMDTKKSLLFDEVIREARVKTLFKGEHAAFDIDTGPVRHAGVELPVSAGLTNAIPNNGPWVDYLLSGLVLVANRKWAAPPRAPLSMIADRAQFKTARVSLSTYVIEV